MLHVKGLSKRFGGVTAVHDVSFDVETGEIFGLLGPNAAGKTTTLRMACGVMARDSGTVELDGLGIEKAKARFGYVAQHFGQYEELSVWENLRFYAQMYGVHDRAHLNALLERFDLMRFRDRAAGALSGGTQRRLAIACALTHNPSLLFLDEPTAGIDPVTRKRLWDDFYALGSEGKSIVVTTHYMEEAERCHNLAFMASGKLIATGTPQSIVSHLKHARVFYANTAYKPQLHAYLNALEGVILLSQMGLELRAVVRMDVNAQTLQEHSGLQWHETRANLEDVFITLTQNEAA